MTTKRALALLTVIMLLFSLPTVAFAQQTPPHIFVGTAFDVSGGTVSAGTIVAAFINGTEQGSATVQAGGKYQMQVSQGPGTLITFKIGSFNASQTFVWEQGGVTLLNLNSVGGVTVVPTPVASVQGPQGEVGPEGPQGSAGPRGDQGPAGAAGSAGLSGRDGEVGAQGPDGPRGGAGEVGPEGPAGGTLLSIIALILSAVAAIVAILAFLKPKTQGN